MEAFVTPFPHAFTTGEYAVGAQAKLVHELDIINLLSAVREKLNWEMKIEDNNIKCKWREELLDSISLSEEKFVFALAELNWLKSFGNGILPSTVDGTFHSDHVICSSLRKELLEEVKKIEKDSEDSKDWHPGSNEQVLDLVHPSLFPLLIGRSPILKEKKVVSESSTRSPVDQIDDYDHLLYFGKQEDFFPEEEGRKLALQQVEGLPQYTKSERFQWLPSDVKISSDGSAKFLSYINNLHPHHYPKLYKVLEKVLTMLVPLFEAVLTEQRHPRKERIPPPDSNWYTDESYEEDVEEEEKIFKPFHMPPFSPPPTTTFPPVKLAGRTVQIITELANIHLKVDKPTYPGGSWHLEGMANERIVASGIFYYYSENVTDSRLLFRQNVREPDYEQYDERGVLIMYGLTNEGELCQKVGSILTKEGRAIAFPNTMQHRVAPFSLADPTRPGHRKILVFFLVDPTIQIISTAGVPPQQRAWFREEIETGTFPDLVMDNLLLKMEWPLGLEEAKKERLLLMDERKYFVKESGEQLFERPFYLCEH